MIGDCHVRHFLIAVDVNAQDSMVAPEGILDDPGASLAGETPSRNGEGCLGRIHSAGSVAGVLVAAVADGSTARVLAVVHRPAIP